jgi:hypothetical protein
VSPGSGAGPPAESPEGPGPAAPRDRCRSGIVLAYAFLGLTIVLLSGLTTKVYRVPLTAQLGLFELLPPSYWLGLALIAASIAIAVWRESDGLVALCGTILLATLAGTPTLFEPTPRYWDTYMHFAEAQNFGLTGHLTTDPFVYSTNWPGGFLVLWTLANLGGIPAMDFLLWYPFLTGGITFLAIFEFLRSMFSRTIARQAAVPTALFAVWAQFHVSPQSLGFVLFLLILATCQRRETRWRVVASIFFVGLVVSHPTSAILLLSLLAIYAVLSSVRRLRAPAPREESRRDVRFSQRLAITFAILWLSWLFFLAIGSAEAARVAVLTRMDNLLAIPDTALNLATARTRENFLPVAPRIRLASVGTYGIFGMIALAALFRDRGSRNEFRFILSALIAAGGVGFADIVGFGGQFYDRCLLLAAMVLPALCFAGFSRIRIPKAVRTGILAVLVGASVATASTAYYLEAFNLVPAESVAAADFINRLPPGSTVMDGKIPQSVWVDPSERPLIVRYQFAQAYPGPLRGLGANGTVYAAYDPAAEIWLRQWYGTEIYLLYAEARQNYSLIYDNGWTEIYSVNR